MSTLTVRVYTAGPGCMACKLTKTRLDRLGIAHEEIPIDTSIIDAIHELGFTTAPVVCAATSSGEQSWDGYRPDRIDALVTL
jgi:glutaredoxin-like protein NrdH